MGRSIALKTGIKISGIAGQIGRAYKAGLIGKDESEENLQTLLRSSRINIRVYTAVSHFLKTV